MARAGRLRVVAGTAGGLRLESPADPATRPTAERVREAVFSSIAADVRRGTVLDLYAGTGALAVEALSRGAVRAVLVERDHREAAVARRNLTRTGLGDVGRVIEADATTFLEGPPPPEAPFALVCCDAPYEVADAVIDAHLARLAAPVWTRPGALVVVERPVGSALRPPPGWGHRFSRAYGDTLVHLVSAGGPDAADP
jgi:16S rRNA (guanine966-N2)-methyltransferase